MTNNHYILTRTKRLKKVDLMEWAQWIGTAGMERVVKQEFIGDIRVSTVFIGVDHNFGDKGEELLFETMIFGGKRNGETTRYPTWKSAEEGHEKIVSEIDLIMKEQ